jgi:hypothetical protein
MHARCAARGALGDARRPSTRSYTGSGSILGSPAHCAQALPELRMGRSRLVRCFGVFVRQVRSLRLRRRWRCIGLSPSDPLRPSGTRLSCKPCLEALLHVVMGNGSSGLDVLKSLLYRGKEANPLLDVFPRHRVRQLGNRLESNVFRCHGRRLPWNPEQGNIFSGTAGTWIWDALWPAKSAAADEAGPSGQSRDERSAVPSLRVRARRGAPVRGRPWAGAAAARCGRPSGRSGWRPPMRSRYR